MVPEWKWEHLGIYLLFRLPKTQKCYDTIWVIVDRLTKFAHFIPVRKTYSMDKFVELYVDGILRVHGVLASIVLDRELQFTSTFKEACTRLQAPSSISTTFHPQTNGQPERNIQILKDILRVCLLDVKGNQDKHLSLLELIFHQNGSLWGILQKKMQISYLLRCGWRRKVLRLEIVEETYGPLRKLQKE